MASRQSLVLRWQDEANPQIKWFLRGIRPDGSFYGEIRSEFKHPRPSDNVHGIARTVEGQLTPNDADAVFTIAAALRNLNHIDDDTPECLGVLADGPVTQPKILLRFRDADRDAETSLQFLRIVGIVRPYLEPLYSTLSADGTETADEQSDARKSPVGRKFDC